MKESNKKEEKNKNQTCNINHNPKKRENDYLFQCPFCLQWMTKQNPPIEVHGHLQCPYCKNNFDPCCNGTESF
ncbi:MAG: hypothetical protein KatS3mg129_1830 [Leptospiraceae bacterium]|nr:MAG: hypothetical protein KatS3mg129_1830 [Leptospiraceae bacterium]